MAVNNSYITNMHLPVKYELLRSVTGNWSWRCKLVFLKQACMIHSNWCYVGTGSFEKPADRPVRYDFELQASKRCSVDRKRSRRSSCSLYFTCPCQTLASVCGKELQRPRVGGIKLRGTQIRVEWIYIIPREQPIKRVDTNIPGVTRENIFFSPQWAPLLLYYVTSAVVSIKNTVVFWKLMKLLTLLIIQPTLSRRPEMLEGRIFQRKKRLYVNDQNKNGVFWLEATEQKWNACRCWTPAGLSVCLSVCLYVCLSVSVWLAPLVNNVRGHGWVRGQC